MNQEIKERILRAVESELDLILEEDSGYVEVERPSDETLKDVFTLELHDGVPTLEMGLFTSNGEFFNLRVPFQTVLDATQGYVTERGIELGHEETDRDGIIRKMIKILKEELKESKQ